MNLSTLHRNALHGLVAQDQRAYQAFQRDHVEPLKREWIEVLGCIEGALGLTPGAIGSTHVLDLATMTVVPATAGDEVADNGTTPAPGAATS